MKRLFSLAAIFTVVLFYGCSKNFAPFSGSQPINLSPMQKTVANSTTDFSFKIFKELASAENDSNVFISPLSISYALAMTANGANGETLQEMLSVLGFGNLTQEDLNSALSSLMSLLTHADPDVILNISNSIWYRQGFPVEQTFLDINKKYYDAEIRPLDFASSDAVDIINSWVSTNTNGKIKEIIKQIDPMTVMFLINAIYFKGIWKYTFDKEKTFQGEFTTLSGKQVECPMMQMKADLPYFETDDFQAVSLDYGNGDFAMALFLPKSGKKAEDIVRLLNSSLWNKCVTEFDSGKQEITVILPRFKTRYEVTLNDTLKKMGMRKAFSGRQADFSRMCKTFELYIDRVIHKTYVSVDEQGTEAAAVTVVEMRYTSTGMSINIDRPFVFVIYEKSSGTVLFEGKINNPLN